MQQVVVLGIIKGEKDLQAGDPCPVCQVRPQAPRHLPIFPLLLPYTFSINKLGEHCRGEDGGMPGSCLQGRNTVQVVM